MRVFLDSCIWISGLLVPDGPSGKILLLGKHGLISILSSRPVFDEIERNLPDSILGIFPSCASCVNPEMVSISLESLPRWRGIVSHKADFHILEGATKGESDYLVSRNAHILNRRVKRDLDPIKVADPIEFLSHFPREG